MKTLILILVTLLLFTACYSPETASTNISTSPIFGKVIYIYDKQHEVCIWVYSGYNQGGITVLPASEVNNPSKPMKLEVR